MAEMVKNLPAMQETWVQSQAREDPLEKGATANEDAAGKCSHGWLVQEVQGSGLRS